MNSELRYPGLRTEPGGKYGWGRERIRRFLRRQFGRPTGLCGVLAGKIMARRPSNRERIEWTVGILEIEGRDRLLEIGFGPGFGIEYASRIASEGVVYGVDHSDVMMRQAGRRNAQAILEGKVVLRQGSASDLPVFEEPFDKIFSINSFHFWNEPVECLRSLRALLKKGGVMAVTLQPRSRAATDSTAKEVGEEIASDFRIAGFSEVTVEVRAMNPVAAACVLGVNSGGSEMKEIA